MKEAFSKLTVLCQLVGQQMKKADLVNVFRININIRILLEK